VSRDPFAHLLRLKKPCANCPFRKEGAIELRPGRLTGIIESMLENDRSTFQCHKTVYSKRGGTSDDEGTYTPSGHEAMCAGAAAYLLKKHRPTVTMRAAFAFGIAQPEDWQEAMEQVID
jgi:hypothetical protein